MAVYDECGVSVRFSCDLLPGDGHAAVHRQSIHSENRCAVSSDRRLCLCASDLFHGCKRVAPFDPAGPDPADRFRGFRRH